MVRAVCLCVLILCFTKSHAQILNIDSLERALAERPDDTSKVNLLNKIISYYQERNNFVAIEYGVAAIALAEKLNYQKGLARALEHVGWINYRKGAYLESFELSARALKINEALNDEEAIARCLNNMAAVSYERKQYADAISDFKRAYIISASLEDTPTAVRSLNNIAFSFLALKKLDSAKWYAEEAKKQGMRGDGHLPAFSLRLLGDIALEKNDIKQALKYFNECLVISDKTANFFVKTSTLHRIGKAYFYAGQNNKALEILYENIELAKKYGFLDELERTHELVSEIHTQNGRSALALNHLQEYLELHDSLNSQRNNERMALMQARYQSEIKQSQINLLTKDTQLKSQEIDRQQAWLYFYIGCVLFSIILLIVLYRVNTKVKRVNSELESKNVEISKQARQLQGMGITKDKLLSIISHDLRSPLSGFRGLLNLFKKDQLSNEEMKNFTHKLDQRLGVLNDDLDNLLQWTQSQLHGLHVNKSAVSLKTVVRDVLILLQDHLNEKELEVIDRIEEEASVLADSNHVKIIIRNIISNAIKFTGHLGKIILATTMQNNHVTLTIQDTGMGMTSSEVEKLFNPTLHFTKAGTGNEKGLGVGLLLTKEFLDKNEARVSIESTPQKGTTFSLIFMQA